MTDTSKPTGRAAQDLTVKGESIERIYGNYQGNRYVVNRRYQRKLVWSLDEKRKFIDSIVNGFPVPIVLLAERGGEGSSWFEIIDGMQRLNAVFSFIENEYAVDGKYFDLNTMAATKQLLDTKAVEQKTPVMPRDDCVRIAGYTLPLSIYEFADTGDVDEVFRRINSGGRKLSRQELRIAGATGHFAQAVRQIAAKVRGDVSASEELTLNEMKKISITSKDLPYGINVEEVFWIKQGILTKEQVRESRDEELVADILAYMLLDAKPSSRSEFLDDFFGFSDGEAQRQRHEAVEVATQKVSTEVAATDFQRVLDQLKITLDNAGKDFGQLMFGERQERVPRYFQVVFLAFYKLIVVDSQEIKDHKMLTAIMQDSGNNIPVPEGGRWGADARVDAVNGAAGVYARAFGASTSYDPAQVRWITRMENILTQSYTEQAAYDFKQGFLRLDRKHKFDEDSFQKIMTTLVGIANIRKGVQGYVLVGVADSAADAKRVNDIYGVIAKPYEKFFITGMDHEATALEKTLDDLFKDITNRIKASAISEPLRDYIARHIKLVRYYDKSVLIFESRAQPDPSMFDGKLYVRHGNMLVEVKPADYAELYRRFAAGT